MEILYKKKIIRDFLSLYKENFWIPLISHICEYGIILFKKKYLISSLNPQDIFKIIENFKIEEKIYDKKTKINLTRDNSFNKKKNIYHSKSKSKSNNKSFSSNKKNNSIKSNLSDKNIFSKGIDLNKRNLNSSRTNIIHNKFKTEINLKKNNNNSNKKIQNFENKTQFKSKRDFSNKSKSKENSLIKNKILNNTISNNNENSNEKKPINNKLMFQKMKFDDLCLKFEDLNHKEIKNNCINENIKNLKGENKLKALIELDKQKYKELNLIKNNNIINNNMNNNNNNMNDINKINNMNNRNNNITNRINNKNLNMNNCLILNEINNNNKIETPKIINTNTNMIISVDEDKIKEKKFEGILDENSNFSFNNTKLLENSPIDTENNISNALNILKSIEEKNNNINNESNKKERYCLNDAPIISIEDKLNSLTKNLSKLNSSINKAKGILSNYNQDNYNNEYFNQQQLNLNSINVNNNKNQNLNSQNEENIHSSVFSSEDYGELNK